MSPVERFIARYKVTRYTFVLVSFPLVFVRDEVQKLRAWEPAMGLADLQAALRWAHTGGALPHEAAILTAAEPARVRTVPERPERLCIDHSGAAIGGPRTRCPVCLGTQEPRNTSPSLSSGGDA